MPDRAQIQAMLKRLADIIKKNFGFGADDAPAPDAAETERLRLDFKARYYSFRQLLAANTRALEAMAEIEKRLPGTEPFSFAFVRRACGTVAVNVFGMIRHMEAIAPGRYGALREAFAEAQARIDALLDRKRELADQRLIIPLEEITGDMAETAGGKMANLGEIRNRLNMRTPPGFVVTAAAHALFMETDGLQQEVERLFQVAGGDLDRNLDLVSSRIRQRIEAAGIPEPIYNAVMAAYEDLKARYTGPRLRLAARSSAHGEDAAGSAFAGQYRSELNVGFPQFFLAYKRVLASKYSPQAIAYKLNRGFRDEDIAMCVGCLAMVDAAAGGVVYTKNPLDSRDDHVYINAVWGLPRAVVDGDAPCDLFVVARDEARAILRRDVRDKPMRVVCLEDEGCIRAPTPAELATAPSLSDDKIRELADMALAIEAHYGKPQDIEWAITAAGELHILQARPLEQLDPTLPEDELNLDRFAPALVSEDGINASPGTAAGRVFKARKNVDILQFPEGAVLVVAQALPLWAPLAARACAVISERGGFAGHLANVAREFGIPAIFGAEGIMDRLENGALVTVAADLRRVYLGGVAPLLEWKRAEPAPMRGSPIHTLLEEAGRHIIPLTLIDPESRDFRPENCATFHDITRFIHEKAVVEMFNFGKDHRFSERAGKQLHDRVPMNWWILNLDDGLVRETPGRYVRLEDIASIPMRAFWEGFTAVPWDGPPALDGGGMAGILFRSTMNTNLVTGGRSRYAERNYFMISRNFCTLHSRLGYHFCTLEAMVSERREENYLGFRFKGGAADYERCLGRVRLIQEILERHGFRVTLNADTLDSRLEGRHMEYMLERLKILGYLSLHTRQLDMVMGNPARARYYKDKLTGDIEGMLTGAERA